MMRNKKGKLLFYSFIVCGWLLYNECNNTNFNTSIISSSNNKNETIKSESFLKFVTGNNISGNVIYEVNEDNKTIRIVSTNNIVGENIKFKDIIEINKKSYNLESISNNAFANCDSLCGTIEFNESIRVIGANAFARCSSIKGSIVFPINIESIGIGAFANCSEIIQVSFLGHNVKSIKDKCFSGCNKLTKVILPKEVNTIGNEAFNDCTLLNNINFNKSIEEIGTSAFKNCKSLTNVDLSLTNIKQLANDTFRDCDWLQCVKLPDQITSIGDNCFYECERLKLINLPCELISIGNSSFYQCSWLDTINFPAKLKTISDYAFENCFALGKNYMPIYLPNSLTYIGSNAFYNTELINRPISSDDNVIYSSEKEGYRKWAIGKINQSNPYSISIEQNTNGIASGLFKGDNKITNVSFCDNSLKYICDYAFSECSKLTKIIIPNSIELIGNRAFANCNKLINVIFNDNVNRNSTCSIGESAFEYCSSLGSGFNEEIVIPYYVSDIGLYAYNNTAYKPNKDGLIYSKKGYGLNCWCMGTTNYDEYTKPEVVLKDNTYGIGPNAFRGNQYITKVSNIDSIQVICDKAFQECGKLQTIGEGKFPTYIHKIGKDAFIGDKALNDKDLLDLSHTCIQQIGDYAFDECENITGSICLPNTMNLVGKYAFVACNGIDSISIDETIEANTKIGTGAFSECKNLTNINLKEGSLNEISESMFVKSSKLESIKLPNSIKKLSILIMD